jgi:hypothetical protein
MSTSPLGSLPHLGLSTGNDPFWMRPLDVKGASSMVRVVGVADRRTAANRILGEPAWCSASTDCLSDMGRQAWAPGPASCREWGHTVHGRPTRRAGGADMPGAGVTT